MIPRTSVIRPHALCVFVVLAACAHGTKPDTSAYRIARERQLEAPRNLTFAATAEKAWLQEKDAYTDDVTKIGFEPDANNRYSYYFHIDGPTDSRTATKPYFEGGTVIVGVDRTSDPNAPFPATVALTGCPITGGAVGVDDDRFLILAAGNLDDDSAFDCWTIASFDRKTADGRSVPALTPHREQEDVAGSAEEVARFDAAQAVERRIERVRELTCRTLRRTEAVPDSFDPIVTEAGLDPWDQPIAVAHLGEKDGEPEFLAASGGADRKLSTDDDLVYAFDCRKRELHTLSALPRGVVDAKGTTRGPAALTTPPNGTHVTEDARAAAGTWVELPGGTFVTGCAPGRYCPASVGPQRRVLLAPFALGRTEVTVGQYARCVAAKACAAPPADVGVAPRHRCNWIHARNEHPMNCVTWNQADAFCAWVGGRLPLSLEWEYAATSGATRTYPWGSDTPDATRATVATEGMLGRGIPYFDADERPIPATSPVGAHPAGASDQGVLDLVGNVAEWTVTRDERGFVVRGGSWAQLATVEEFVATEAPWSEENGAIGFRCARSRSSD